MTWYEVIISAHLAVTDNVSHGTRMRSNRYFVWTEDGSNDVVADNRHCEKSTTGTTDLYTKSELDEWASELENSFDENGISWRKLMTEYEDETGFWHHEWEWNVCGNA